MTPIQSFIIYLIKNIYTVHMHIIVAKLLTIININIWKLQHFNQPNQSCVSENS